MTDTILLQKEEFNALFDFLLLFVTNFCWYKCVPRLHFLSANAYCNKGSSGFFFFWVFGFI